jgi:hypothetical protein
LASPDFTEQEREQWHLRGRALVELEGAPIASREIERLIDVLRESERVQLLLAASNNAGTPGLAVLTAERVLFLFRTMFRQAPRIAEIPLHDVLKAEWETYAWKALVRLHYLDGDQQRSFVLSHLSSKEYAEHVATLVNEAASAARRAQTESG